MILRDWANMQLGGKRHTKTHTLCRRCGNRSFHRQHKSQYQGFSEGLQQGSKRDMAAGVGMMKRAIRVGTSRTEYLEEKMWMRTACGYPAAKLRSYNWGLKAKRRKTTGTGRMRHLKEVSRKFKNGFREGTSATKKVKASSE
ncbi:hypothetical protein QFC20_002327 [Naganishia adeliensis]|uniref:Uncharacterized protein n=1 Tax=Naganishia adeliensis TaxID=92952 RepID=A0ACC2WL32_9TREE|nr:hypothetical protein QFC20_002327 [Naganishia adeliensis]